MITPTQQDAKHKYQMFRLLREILKNNTLSNRLMFKGGTYAALTGALDRFSVDLDFDLPNNKKKEDLRILCHDIFKKLNFEIKDESKNHLQFFLKYESKEYERNTLKLEINDNPSPFNKYEKVNLKELNMYCNAHSIDTMFANKLVAAKARYDKNGKIAGRDFYDLHKFFIQSFSINKKVVENLTNKKYTEYLSELTRFIKDKVNSRNLIQDLNVLLNKQQIRSVENIKEELLTFLKDELKRNTLPPKQS